jgi:hypothetical protein
MPSKDEYPEEAVQACLSVMLELFTHLKSYRDYIVLIGGWVPFFLTRDQTEEPHIGSLDIDLALDSNRIPETAYATILERLEERGYRPFHNRRGDIIPARYERIIPLADGRPFHVRVDFLAPEYGGTKSGQRHQRVQDLLAHKARGCDLVFEHFVEVEIGGQLPNGADHREKIKIADSAACFVMKAFAFDGRNSEKDAYDLFMLTDSLGAQAIVEQILPLKSNKLMSEALSIIRERFRTPRALGPTSVADFLKATGDDGERIKRRVFELFQLIVSQIEER